MSELISRKAAVDAIYGITTYKGTIPLDSVIFNLNKVPSAKPEKICIANVTLSDEQIRGVVEKAKNEAIQVLSSEQSERKKGKWIKVGHWGRSYKCNQCGNYLDFNGVNAGRGDANFCPNCGADMRGENNK